MCDMENKEIQIDWVENDAIGQDRIELLEALRKFEVSKAKRMEFEALTSILHTELVTLCPHDPANLQGHQSYTSGGYDYTGNTDYWDECQICGTRINQSSKSDGYYG